MASQGPGELSVEPVLRYPSEAEAGSTYLLTFDLRPTASRCLVAVS